MNNFIELTNISKHYGEKVVLERTATQVAKGEFVTLVGASGCGKSTFLKLLLGTEVASSGAITIEGQLIEKEPSSERGIVFQKYSVFPHLNVRQNVALGIEFERSVGLGRLFGAKRKDAIETANGWLEAVGLSASAELYPHELSGGMQQRLALAQALVKKPKILLLDEPFGALDPGIRKDMHELVLKLWQENQLTVFMVTHDLREGFHLGSRLWVFDKRRYDPHAPDRFGSTITFDLPLNAQDATKNQQDLEAISSELLAMHAT